MKIFNVIWSLLCTIWMVPLIAVAYFGMFAYACYAAIRFNDVEFVTLVRDCLIDTCGRCVELIKENMAG